LTFKELFLYPYGAETLQTGKAVSKRLYG